LWLFEAIPANHDPCVEEIQRLICVATRRTHDPVLGSMLLHLLLFAGFGKFLQRATGRRSMVFNDTSRCRTGAARTWPEVGGSAFVMG